MITLADVLEFLINSAPGRTHIELGQAIYADAAYQQRVNQSLKMLVGEGRIEARGEGGFVEPHRYYPLSAAADRS